MLNFVDPMKRFFQHGVVAFLSLFTLLLFSEISMVGAQSNPPGDNNGYPYQYAKFSPSMAIIIVVLIAALFFMGFFSIYIRHCSDNSGAAGSVRRALSRRAAAARGLDASILETFPTLSYSEVKNHKIGKEVLECAVCLNEFEDDETIRLIPKCDHVFHPECIDAWLESHVTCPVCRANLVSTDGPIEEPELINTNEENNNENHVERRSNSSRNEQVVIQVEISEEGIAKPGMMNRNSSFEYRSVRRPKRFGLGLGGKFRSYSTGHSLVIQPGENLDRFTLKLPEQVRKEVMDRASLNRTKSCATILVLPREGSSRRNSFNRASSFLSRALSMRLRSPRVVAENGEAGTSNATPVKLPSFKC